MLKRYFKLIRIFVTFRLASGFSKRCLETKLVAEITYNNRAGNVAFITY